MRTLTSAWRRSRGSGGGLRPRVWLCLRAAAWGQLDPGWNLTIGRRSQFLLVLGHMKRPRTTLYGVVFQKLNGPLLTSMGVPLFADIAEAADPNFTLSPRALPGASSLPMLVTPTKTKSLVPVPRVAFAPAPPRKTVSLPLPSVTIPFLASFSMRSLPLPPLITSPD